MTRLLRTPRLRGFTLLELLVVISIIGILIAMGSAAFSVAQKQGRDARRRGDMKAYQNCMEQYYATNNSSYLSASCASGLVDPGAVATGYNFITPTATEYCACATLENGKGNNTVRTNCTTLANNASSGFFCVKNQQ